MTVSILTNDLGDLAARGRVSIQRNLVRMAMPEDAVEAVNITLTGWLNGATLSASEIETHGLTVTNNGVTLNVWGIEVEGVGHARLTATANDGRKLVTIVENVDPERSPWADRYRYR